MVLNVDLGKIGMVDYDKIKPISNDDFKPTGGLWGCRPDVEYSWRRFCFDDGWVNRLSKEHAEVVIKDDARVLYLETREDYERFYDSYGVMGRGLFFDYERLATNYDVVDFNFVGNIAQAMQLNCDCSLVLNRDAVGAIHNPEQVTKYTESECRALNSVLLDSCAANYSGEFEARKGMEVWRLFNTRRERDDIVKLFYSNKGWDLDDKAYSIMSVADNYGKLNAYIDRNNGEITDEADFNRILIEFGMLREAPELFDEVMWGLKGKSGDMPEPSPEFLAKVEKFEASFSEKYIDSKRPWCREHLKIREHVYKEHDIRPELIPDIEKELLRAVLREPSYNTWDEMGGRIPAIADCLSA